MRSPLALAILGLALSAGSLRADLDLGASINALLDPIHGIGPAPGSVVWHTATPSRPASLPLPPGTLIEPAHSPPELPPQRILLQRPAFVFWIDDEPEAEFIHPTRFAIVLADNPAPTIANQGIQVSSQSWWPRITLPGQAPHESHPTSQSRTSDAPPGPTNPDGLVSGIVPPRPPATPGPGTLPSRPARPAEDVPADPGACALILRGAPDTHMASNVVVFKDDLIHRFGVAADRIVVAKDGAPATCDDLVAAIAKVVAMKPACERLYVRITSHGGQGCILLADGCLAATNLCRKFGPIAAAGMRVHLLINACYSHGLVDTNTLWNFAAGSTVVTSAHSNKTSYGGVGFDSGAGSKAVSLFADAFSECLRAPAADVNADGRVDDIEAFDWVWKQRPCYSWTADRRMRYPAGRKAGDKEDPLVSNPYPQKTVAGRDPVSLAVVVRNDTTEPKTDFHWIFAGRVTTGKATARRATPGGALLGSDPWGKPVITYDEKADETMVCWESPAVPLHPGQALLFSYGNAEKPLRLRRSYWTPTPTPPAESDRVPVKSGTLRVDGDFRTPTWREASVPVEYGGSGHPFQGIHGYGRLAEPVAAEDLHFSNPVVQTAATGFLGPVFVPPGGAVETPIPLAAPGQPLPGAVVLISQTQPVPGVHTMLSFELFIPEPPPVLPPRVEVRREGAHLVLSWAGDGLLVEAATLGPIPAWQPVPNGNVPPVVIPLDQAPSRFFRLLR